jgi:hypothetical protein
MDSCRAGTLEYPLGVMQMQQVANMISIDTVLIFFWPFCPSFEITTSHETQIVDFLSSFTIDFAVRQGRQSPSGRSSQTSKEDP